MNKQELIAEVEKLKDVITDASISIWNNPEISGEEKFSSELIKNILKNNEFKIYDINNVEYAFYAEYGQGSPVIAIMGEYDALPGMSQKKDIKHNPVIEGGNGHGCGHNLLGSAAMGAALALKNYIKQDNVKGTIRFYGCPAEETLNGKVEMIRENAFDGCDVALSWHPMNVNTPIYNSYLANNSIKFKFNGISAHAAAVPHLGRSALDAVELMNTGANYMREHVIDKARIHYTITDAGGPPNIVPKEAESWYFIRAPHRKDVTEITDRLIKISEGAALMTETEVSHKYVAGCYEMMPNKVLFDLTYKNMQEISGPDFTLEELQFADEIQKTVSEHQVEDDLNNYKIFKKYSMHKHVVSKEVAQETYLTGSSDSGDVSWILPMNCFLTACWPLGINPHTWQATSMAGSEVAQKGMLYASKVFVSIAYDLLNDSSLVESAKKEFSDKTKNNKYVLPLK
ncbi:MULTISPECIES: amidohydrolase [unclassified Sedimentibacter]|uniref:amidohydrolase n=1 Tax=unclassified Sedimentibacter TaxID=2649220 RepID=UPI0027E1CEBA|nr:amidohydrolase [Sedimentibacter sp. MB35-C1]WMJ76161.1 amidohydrolase [Sedimentibacter sp. MB35-C1]